MKCYVKEGNDMHNDETNQLSNDALDQDRDTTPIIVEDIKNREEKCEEERQERREEVEEDQELEPEEEEVLTREEENVEDREVAYEEHEVKEADNRSTGKRIFDWIFPIALAVVIALFVRFFIGGVTSVQGSSMVPTLHSGDLVVVNKIPTYTASYHRSDIVVIDAPDEPNTMYIKRIVGLPGEKIQIVDNHLYIDGKLYKEYYIHEIDTPAYNATEWTLADDEYFVLGDNRPLGRSKDSRMFGPIKAGTIDGVAAFRIFPLSDVTGL